MKKGILFFITLSLIFSLSCNVIRKKEESCSAYGVSPIKQHSSINQKSVSKKHKSQNGYK